MELTEKPQPNAKAIDCGLVGFAIGGGVASRKGPSPGALLHGRVWRHKTAYPVNQYLAHGLGTGQADLHFNYGSPRAFAQGGC